MTDIAQTGMTCHKCKVNLIRITEPNVYSLAVCPSCLAAGDFEQVAGESAGLDNSRIWSEEDKKMIREAGAHLKG